MTSSAATPPVSSAERERALGRWAVAYGVLALLTMAVSARLWWASPLRLTRHEFDYFLGLFHDTRWALDAVLWGRGLQTVLMLGLGGLYLGLVRRLMAAPEAWSNRAVVRCIAALSLVFALGLPWVSPDVFYYIGTGWLEAHHGLNPYVDVMARVPGAATEPMFANVFPAFLQGITPYGPVFQKLAAAVGLLSGGHEKLALALFKGVFLALHAGNCWLVYRLAPAAWRRVALLAYGANPLILFSVLTCVHNDHLTNFFVLAALALLRRGGWWAAGAALGMAFSCKYFPVVFLPAFVAAAWCQAAIDGRPRVGPSLRLLAGFAGVALGAQLVYPGSLAKFTSMASSGFDVYRNSVHHLIVLLLGGAHGLSDYGQVLQRAFIVSYPVLLLAFWPRLRRAPFEACVQLCLTTTLAYFVLANACNQEWYLTWLMGLAFIQARGAAWRLALWLSVAFVPLVIFTVKSHPFVGILANTAIYLILAGGTVDYLRRLRAEPLPAAA